MQPKILFRTRQRIDTAFQAHIFRHIVIVNDIEIICSLRTLRDVTD